jgi:aryl-alcohol dehydrogenase-like predicted oxidoreductase
MDSKIVLGLWPIAGVTTVGVTPEDARRTLSAALDAGITAFDTAYSYGFDGESDRLLGEFLRGRSDQLKVMGKVGQRWSEDRKRVVDGSAAQLIADAETSLARLNIEAFDVLFFHQPDERVALDESARAFETLQRRGLCHRVGICNASPAQLRQFADLVPTTALQCPLNLVQRGSQRDLIPGFLDQASGSERGEVFVFWVLMKGLLAGKIRRDHQFAEGDSRPNYPVFQGQLRSTVHDALDRLKVVGEELDLTVAQLSVGWAISQPHVTAALVGARRPEQIVETAGSRPLTPAEVRRIESIVDPAVRCFESTA